MSDKQEIMEIQTGDKQETTDNQIEDMKEVTIIDRIEKHLGLITTISSLLGLIITGLFKCFSYYHEKGYYDFWGIPLKYMEIDYSKILMQFVLNFAGFVIIIGITLIYMEFYNASKIIGKIFLHLILFFINAAFMVYAIYSVGGTISDALDLSNKETIYAYTKIEAFLYLIEIPLIHIYKKKKPYKIEIRKGKKNKNQNFDKKAIVDKSEHIKKEPNEKKKSKMLLKNGIGIYLIILVAYIVGVIWYTCIALGNDRKEACKDINKFEIVQDEKGQNYVILATYGGQFFVKTCTVYENQHFLAINSEKYMLIELKNIGVDIYDFSEYHDVFKLLTNKEYMALPVN